MSKLRLIRLKALKDHTTLVGMVVCTLLGWFATTLPSIRALSFDLPVMLAPELHPPGEALIVTMDERNLAQLHPNVSEPWKPGNWSRATHARFLQKAWALGASMVVFDVTFLSPKPSVDDVFVPAIKDYPGQVIVGARLFEASEGGVEMANPILPIPEIESVADWGMVEFFPTKDRVVRQHYLNPMLPAHPSLAAKAAEIWGHALDEPDRKRWFNYYGRTGTLPSMDYARLLEQPETSTNLFAGKALFVGWVATPPNDHDLHRTPYTRRYGEQTPGVELHATAFLNLIHKDWLEELASPLQMLIIACMGVLLMGGFRLCRLRWALVVAIPSLLIILVGACLLTWLRHAWFPWLAVAAVQLPIALVWTRLFPAPPTPANVESGSTTVTVTSQDATRRIPLIPDHSLLRCFGRGGYGEVWLAKDIVGNYRAVKIIYRTTFTNEEPFQREFRGIQTYSPISRTHPGWVDILHVGRNEAEGCFFYIMELGDDTTRGQDIDPNDYAPKTLQTVVKQKGRLSLKEGIELGVALAEALEHLHGRGLIHRDIKPSNVIYVQEIPKFADIGLVTHANAQGDVSMVGTEGYMAPEGPGTPAADIYSLGKLLYEVFTGRDRRAYPEMHTALFEQFSGEEWSRLQDILDKACAESPEQRYATATALRDDLTSLLERC